MARLLICTVGTSLLTNRDDRPWTGWQRKDPLPEAGTVDAWLRAIDPVKASAETNTFRAVGLSDEDRVLLLHSDTPEGQFCSQRLLSYIRSGICRNGDEIKLNALSYHQGSFAQRGLRSLVNEAIAAVRQAHNQKLEPVFCATGGFKAEIAFLNVLGALLKVEVCYIHEQFREIVRLPCLPLTWDTEMILRHRDFFEWIDAEPRVSSDVESWLCGRPELRSLIDDAPDGHTYLNAAGELLFKAAQEKIPLGPRAIWPPAVCRLPEEKNGLSNIEHHRPRGWDKFVDRLAVIDCVKRIVYDAAACSGPCVRVLDAKEGKIAVRYGNGQEILPLAVFTTAEGEAQTEWVADYIRKRLLK